MATATDCTVWAKATFGDADLGNQRRTARLVTLAGDLAAADGGSTAKAHADDEAAHEGAYRFLRNEHVVPERIAEAGFRASVERANSVENVLAIEDTSTLGYTHAVTVPCARCAWR